MVKLSHGAILEQLEAHGLRHRSVQLHTEGQYLPTDVDWNNKDVIHRNHLHSLIQDVVCVIERDLQASISFQRVLGVPFPLVLVHYDTGPDHQTHFLTVMAWTMVTTHEFVALSRTRTRAVTTYTVAGSRFWMFFWPAIRALLRRNHAKLMSEDVPLRARRGLLRSWGYTFRGDDGPRDPRATMSIATNNVLLPDPPVEPPAFSPIPVTQIREDRCTLVGRSDHLGLLLRRQGRRVLAFSRMCPHEGAEMDSIAIIDGCQTCSWHGRTLEPLAVIDLDGDEPSADTDWHHVAVEGGRLTVTVINPGSAPTSSRREQGAVSPARAADAE